MELWVVWVVASLSKDDARDGDDQNTRRRTIEALHAAAMATTGTAAGAVRPPIQFHMLLRWRRQNQSINQSINRQCQKMPGAIAQAISRQAGTRCTDGQTDHKFLVAQPDQFLAHTSYVVHQTRTARTFSQQRWLPRPLLLPFPLCM